MKRCLRQTATLCLLLFLFTVVAAAQGSLAVKSFKLLPHDTTANSAGTTVKDQNGETCALIKVVTSETGFHFDIGSLGVTDVKQEVGEYWVYVPQGAKRITIKHPKLGVLREYYFNMPINGGNTYELVLASGTMQTIVHEDAGGQFVVLRVVPKDATVKIDGTEEPVNDGVMQKFLPYGDHQYNVSAPLYEPTAAAFKVADQRVDITVQLEYAFDPVTVHVPAGAQLFVDGQQKSVSGGVWRERLTGGMHILEARRDSHRPTTQSITVVEHTPQEVHLNAPTPIVGSLQVSTTPVDVNVAVDGRVLGQAPNIFRNILVGSHQLSFTKDGYERQTRNVTIEEGKTAQVSVTLSEQKKKVEPKFSAPKVRTPRVVPENSTVKTELDGYLTITGQAGALMGVGVGLGIYVYGVNVEGIANIGLAPQTLWLNYPDKKSEEVKMTGNSYILRVGYGVPIHDVGLRFTPQVGYGWLYAREDKTCSYATHATFASAALRMEWKPFKELGFSLVPEYYFRLGQTDTYKAMADASSRVKGWSNGFNISLGINICF